MLKKSYSESELVFALIGAVGTELRKVQDVLDDRLKVAGYDVATVRITMDVIPKITEPEAWPKGDEFARLTSLMDAGNRARQESGDHGILALGAAAFISGMRPKESTGKAVPAGRKAYIISSLKHPEEVERLREIYPHGFYLIGVHADRERRRDFLMKDKRMQQQQADSLIARDEDEHIDHGQRVSDTFHLSDFFVRIDGDDDRLKRSLWLLLDLLFGHPYVTPTFDEYAMFMAFAASLRSADLSRQVGAVVAIDQQVVATGANEVPRAGGGQYWPAEGTLPEEATFPNDGRDFSRGIDPNVLEQQRIIDQVVDRASQQGIERDKIAAALAGSRIRDLTEFGRVVHAEMEALLSCGRARVPMKGGTLYTTTFPCHNCAKHIVAAGIQRVVFIEPYQKSKAAEFHTDSIRVGFAEQSSAAGQVVRFEPFVGVGPRRFFDLFSLRLGSGYPLRRKDKDGRKLNWRLEEARLRLQMLPASYLDLELIASSMFNQARDKDKDREASDAGKTAR